MFRLPFQNVPPYSKNRNGFFHRGSLVSVQHSGDCKSMNPPEITRTRAEVWIIYRGGFVKIRTLDNRDMYTASMDKNLFSSPLAD